MIATSEIKQARSGTDSQNIQEILDAGVSGKHALLNGQQQYELPTHFAEFFNSLLPSVPAVILDPQVASGNLVNSGMPSWVSKYGIEIDRRFDGRGDSVDRLIGNCVDIFGVLDDVFPDLRFQAINANPPFAIRWNVPGGTDDSSNYTWKLMMQRLAPDGYGFFVCNWKTIERFGIHQHERCYLYQRFPAGVWPGVQVEIGVVHFDAHPNRPARIELQYTSLDMAEHGRKIQAIKDYYQSQQQWSEHHRKIKTVEYVTRQRGNTTETSAAFLKVREILNEEKKSRPDFNIWLDREGMLRTYLSTRFTLKRKLTKEDVLTMSKINKCHPLALTTERESRLLMANLVSSGIYTIQPEAKAAVEAALVEVNRLSAPIMPITEFATVAFCDEEDSLLCISNKRLGMDRVFTKGKRYDLRTSSYTFTQKFIRNKPHYDEDQGMYTAPHNCELKRVDKYVAVVDDQGRQHRFMESPEDKRFDHEESSLWATFKKPDVKTVAETHPEQVEHNKLVLSTCEMLANFQFYPGQIEYQSRVAVKDYGVIAAETGAGKSLFAISLIQVKAPKRALIVAPQGTMKTSSTDDDEDDDEQEFRASQWLLELQRFAPGMPVFQLFSMDDYHRILKANNGELPAGIFVTYYEALLSNNSRETASKSWNDARLIKEMQNLTGTKTSLPPGPAAYAEPERFWCESVGHEENGIRCILQPCMATQIGHLFDFVALDEGHRMGNLDSNTTQMLIRLQPKYRYVLSASVIMNVVSNIFAIMGWICVEGWFKGGRRNAAWPYARNELGRFIATFQSVERDFTQEEMNAAAARKAGNNRYRGSRCEKVSPIISSPARLLKILNPNIAHISKVMCNPSYKEPKIVDVRVPMGSQQMSLYVHFMDRGNISGHPLIRARKQVTYLRNICADPKGFSHGGPRVLSNFNPKTVSMLELARDIINKGDQVIIICARKGQTDTLHVALRDAGVLCSRIDSTVPAEQHSYQSNLIKSQRNQVLLMGLKCANAYSFDMVPNMIIGSIEYAPGHLVQASGRINRVNSKYDRTVWCVLVEHSLEATMFDVCSVKQDSADLCLRGQRVPRDFKPLDMSEVLAKSIMDFREESLDERACEQKWPQLRSSFVTGNFNQKGL